MKLYELEGAWRELYAKLEEGEIDQQTFDDTVEAALAEATPEALERAAKAVKNMATDVEVFRREARRFGDKAKNIDYATERIKARIHGVMEASGQTKVRAGLFTIRVQRNSNPSLIFPMGEGAVPAEFLKTEPDNSAIRELLASGETPAWAALKEGEHVRIS